MELEKLLREYLSKKGIDTTDYDFSDFGQEIADQKYVVYDKITKSIID